MGLMPKNVTQSLNRTARPTITTGGGPQNDPANGVPNKTIRTNIEGNDYGGNGAYYSLNVSITTTAYDRQDSSTPQGLPWSDSGRLSPNSLFWLEKVLKLHCSHWGSKRYSNFTNSYVSIFLTQTQWTFYHMPSLVSGLFGVYIMYWILLYGRLCKNSHTINTIERWKIMKRLKSVKFIGKDRKEYKRHNCFGLFHALHAGIWLAVLLVIVIVVIVLFVNETSNCNWSFVFFLFNKVLIVRPKNVFDLIFSELHRFSEIRKSQHNWNASTHITSKVKWFSRKNNKVNDQINPRHRSPQNSNLLQPQHSLNLRPRRW